MRDEQFWLTEEQFAKIEPHLPTDTRGKERVDDRRVISGIVHVLKSGGRWIDAPSDYGPRKTLYDGFVRWAEKGVWVHLFETLAQAGGPPSHVWWLPGRQSPPLGGGRKRGEQNQAVGRSRGGRTTKIHALTDAFCRPIAFMLTGGHVADCKAGAAFIERLPDCEVLHADKGYKTRTPSAPRSATGAVCWANIPPKANRIWKNVFSPFLYRSRNAIERMFCRLKDFRRVATRYDRNAANFLAAVCIAATVSYWL